MFEYNINVVLSMILNVAIRDGVMRNNPCTGAMKELKRKYAGTKKVVRALTQAEQEVFEDFLKRPGIFHCLYPLITVMLYTRESAPFSHSGIFPYILVKRLAVKVVGLQGLEPGTYRL